MTETTETTATTAEPILAMEVGTYVEFTDAALEDNNHVEFWKGRIGVIDSYNSDNSEVWVEVLNHSWDSYGRAKFFKPSTLTVHPDQAAAKQIRDLAAWEDRYHHQRTIIRKQAASLETFKEKIVGVITDEGYCDEYEKVADKVNELMFDHEPEFRLLYREQEFHFDVRTTGAMTAYHSVVVQARTEDEARDMLEDDPDSFFDADDILTDEARNDCFEDVETEIVR
jgi:hypothetical protein